MTQQRLINKRIVRVYVKRNVPCVLGAWDSGSIEMEWRGIEDLPQCGERTRSCQVCSVGYYRHGPLAAMSLMGIGVK
jgi:hypothetical protein